MCRIKKSLLKPYDILITEDFGELVSSVKELGSPSQIAIITDSNVASYYLQEVKDLLGEIAPVSEFIFEAGEASKNFETVFGIYDGLLKVQFDRSGLVIALGGGVVGDLAGFVASSYMRGVPFVQIPTTIVAQNDSSMGGKVGIDYDQHKNMIGAFYQPQLVYMNVKTLDTLPKREVVAGLSEVIKHGLIKDTHLYEYLRENRDKILNRDQLAIKEMTQMSCLVKVSVVEEDPTEKGIRKILNFGHTIGHAIETLSGFTMIHGECVGYGMAMAAWLSYQRGYLTMEQVEEAAELMKDYGLLQELGLVDEEKVYEQMAYDKKKAHGKVPFVLLKAVGEAVVVNDMTHDEVISAIKWVRQKCE